MGKSTESDKLYLHNLVKQHYPEEYAKIHNIPITTVPKIQDIRKQNLEAFFARKGRRCPKCRTKVTISNSAGGRYKKYHVDCAPRIETKDVV